MTPLTHQEKLHSDPADNVNILNRQRQPEFTDEDEYDTPKSEGDPSLAMQEIHVTPEGNLKLM